MDEPRTSQADEEIGWQPPLGGIPTLLVHASYPMFPAATLTPTQLYELAFGPTFPNVAGYITEVSQSRAYLQVAGMKVLTPPNWQAGGNFVLEQRLAMLRDGALVGMNTDVYDTNGDGTIDSRELLIITYDNYDGGAWGANRNYQQLGGCVVPSGNVKPVCSSVASFGETTSFTMIAHETMHSLGAVDLYGIRQAQNYAATLMGSSPLDRNTTFSLDPWHKRMLGWTTPRVFDIHQSGWEALRHERSTADRPDTIVLGDSAHPREYFMLEHRSTDPTVLNYDQDTLGEGIAVWRVTLDTNNQPTVTYPLVRNATLATGSWHYHDVTVMGGQQLQVQLVGTGDADLYVRWNASPTRTAYDCASTSSSSYETCWVTAPGAATTKQMARIGIYGFGPTQRYHVEAAGGIDADVGVMLLAAPDNVEGAQNYYLQQMTSPVLQWSNGDSTGTRILVGAASTAWPETLGVNWSNDANYLIDSGFEGQGATLGWPWSREGTGAGGVDRGVGYQHGGANNAWLRASSGWNAITQWVPVVRDNSSCDFRFSGWIRTSTNVTAGYFGVRSASGTILRERPFGPLPSYGFVDLTISTGCSSGALVPYVGFWAPNSDAWIQVDDLALTKL